MNDQCMNCTVRGDLDACLKTPCSQHKSWYAQTLTAKIKEALAQPEQEPLAYIRKDQLQQAAQSPMLCEVTPEPRQDRIGIYTTPPQRKPLTDAQKKELFKEWADARGVWPRLTHEEIFYAGIKAACGIKENT